MRDDTEKVFYYIGKYVASLKNKSNVHRGNVYSLKANLIQNLYFCNLHIVNELEVLLTDNNVWYMYNNSWFLLWAVLKWTPAIEHNAFVETSDRLLELYLL